MPGDQRTFGGQEMTDKPMADMDRLMSANYA